MAVDNETIKAQVGEDIGNKPTTLGDATHRYGIKYNLELPIIDEAYQVVEGKLSAKEALHNLLARSLKTEKYW